jgi:hypothetical protein
MVKQRLAAHAVDFSTVVLGEVRLNNPVSEEQFINLKADLNTMGFELLDDRKATVVTRIKSCIIRYIHGDDAEMMNRKLSVLLAESLGMDYNNLSALFSAVEGLTIENMSFFSELKEQKNFWPIMN